MNELTLPPPKEQSLSELIEALPQENMRQFLRTFRLNPLVAEASKIADVHCKTVYRWVDRLPAFAAAYKECQEEAADNLEAEALRRARDGVEEPVFYQGKVVGAIRKYSDTLMIVLLKAFRPHKYVERVVMEQAAADIMRRQQDQNYDFTRMSEEQLADFNRLLVLARRDS